MLSSEKINKICSDKSITVDSLAGHLVHGGFDRKNAASAIRNWQKGLMKPLPTSADVEHLANGLGVSKTDISQWHSCYKYAPMSALKARLITNLISGMGVQEALDVLKFSHQRAASFVTGVLKTAIADADSQEANVDNLYVSQARVDDAGRRIGTKTWIAKDRGRAHPIKKHACHIHITVSEE